MEEAVDVGEMTARTRRLFDSDLWRRLSPTTEYFVDKETEADKFLFFLIFFGSFVFISLSVKDFAPEYVNLMIIHFLKSVRIQWVLS